MDNLGLALSYDDVSLKTCYSDVVVKKVDLSTRFSRNVPLNCPIVGSPMDTVTEHKMAIEMAKLGGLGIIHRNLSPKDQAIEVARVKFYLNGHISKPICVKADDVIADIIRMIKEREFTFHSFPVMDNDGKAIGLLTGNDFEFCTDYALRAVEVMSKDLVTSEEGISLKDAYQIMLVSKKKVLPLINSEGEFSGMYVFSDVKRLISGGSSIYNIDSKGNLRVGATVGVGEEALERVELMANKGVDVIIIDTAHGDSKAVFSTLRELKNSFSKLDIVAGNVSEGESAKRLVDDGADGIRVGQGPGSICSTRVVAGVGCPQLTAVHECSKAIRGSDVPVCADGGIKFSGDITKAIAAGGDTVMLGGMLAGTKESPGKTIIRQGMPVKMYRGMGSQEAMQSSKASRERYGQTGEQSDKLVPEGVSGVMPYKGDVAKVIFQLVGGLQSGMGYLGANNIKSLQEKANFHRVSKTAQEESHPHTVTITEEAPNYSR
ncbi:IMP dehydrogenase [Candidatus Pacearchaeota archaeon]|nr:IMP dehydrogenase [Candidatus Pacearchaeota archaeon]